MLLLAAAVSQPRAAPAASPGGPAAFGVSEPTALVLPYRAAAAQPSEGLEAEMLRLTNGARAAAGLAPLEVNAVLQRIAQDYGRALFAWGYLSHLSPARGSTPVERVEAAGLPVHLVGENLAYAADVPQAFVALMASPPHRLNILDPAYRLVGIGVLDGRTRGVVVVEDFTDGILSRTPPRGNIGAQTKPVTQ